MNYSQFLFIGMTIDNYHHSWIDPRIKRRIIHDLLESGCYGDWWLFKRKWKWLLPK